MRPHQEQDIPRQSSSLRSPVDNLLKSPGRSEPLLGPSTLFRLQRDAGNRAVIGMLADHKGDVRVSGQGAGGKTRLSFSEAPVVQRQDVKTPNEANGEETLPITFLQRMTGEEDELLGVPPENHVDSQLPAEKGEEIPAEENGSTDAVQRTPLRGEKLVVQRSSCPPYNGYSTPTDVETYNCAGLAHRSYDWKNLGPAQSALTAGTAVGCGDRCSAGRVKHWFWEYDLHLEDSAGRRGPTSHDFHTVAGVSSTTGDPSDVLSKNGKRPVYGPGTGPSFRPPPRDQARTNDRSDTPVTDSSGNPIDKVREGFAQTCHCLPCPSQQAPLQGPPLK
jgi:hypothetical protein